MERSVLPRSSQKDTPVLTFPFFGQFPELKPTSLDAEMLIPLHLAA
jgi:hypothetical protein